MSLAEKQQQFTSNIAKLILKAEAMGYKLTFGDAYRDPRVHGEMGVKKSYSEGKSAHKHRLAVDFNLFKDGVFLQNTEDHAPLGVYWESLGGVWGGRFNDGNHYSWEHKGIK